jgi:hypothetical protein
VRNRSSERLASFTLAAAIVAGDGTVKAIPAAAGDQESEAESGVAS